MRILVIALIIIINLILQSTLMQHLAIGGIIPNTAIIIIVSYSLLRGKYEGAVCGIFSGLIHDILFGNSLGYFALLGLLVGYLCGRQTQNFYRENCILPIFPCIIVVFLYSFTIYFTSFLFNGDLNFIYFLNRGILPEAVYTALLSPFIYRLLFAINDWLEYKERYKHRLF